MPGGIRVDYVNPLIPRRTIDPLSSFGNPASFTAAARTQGNDYDAIMKSYRDFLNTNNAGSLSPTNITPQNVSLPNEVIPREVTPTLSPYSQSEDVTKSLADLSDLATTGGLSEGDIANIRARDISPIRSIYANAQRNVERQRALQGGNSPNFNAVQSKMAREESDIIGNKTTDVNAGIAEMVQRGKLSAAPAYASASSSEAARKAESNRINAEIVNQINEANAGRFERANTGNINRALDVNTGNVTRNYESQVANTNRALQESLARRQASLSALEGMKSLYGTTPALTSLFGNQVSQAANISQNQQQINQQRRRDNLNLVSRVGFR